MVPVTEGLAAITAPGIGLFVLAGLIGTVAGRLFRFVAIDRVGASVAAALGNLHPLFAALLAIALLGERVTIPIMAGTVVIVFGTTLLSIAPQPGRFRRWMLVLPVLSAFCFGIVAVLRKIGLSHVGPVLGAAVNVTTAFVVFGAFLLAAGRRDAMVCRGRTLGHFVLAGLAENAAVFINIVALRLGTVSVVSPLYGTSPIFVLVLTLLCLRGVEVLTARIVAGTVLIVLGVYLLTAL
jgi:uncharacterized membrane protein